MDKRILPIERFAKKKKNSGTASGGFPYQGSPGKV